MALTIQMFGSTPSNNSNNNNRNDNNDSKNSSNVKVPSFIE